MITYRQNALDQRSGMNLCLAFVEIARLAIWLDHVCRPRPSILQIKAAVCQRFHLNAIEMTSERRARHIARPRQIAMYLCRELTPRSLPQIGKAFDRDHTTVIHACRNVERLRGEDSVFDGEVQAIADLVSTPSPQGQRHFEGAR